MQRVITVRNAYTGTYPLVYHEPGDPRERSANHIPTLADRILSGPRYAYGCPPDLTIVAWNNYAEPSVIEKTAAHAGIPLAVYGKGMRWKSNYETKLRLMYEACRDATTAYVMGLDSRDIIIVAPPAEIVEKFKEMDAGMLFGASMHTFGFYRNIPDLAQFFDEMREPGDGPFSYLNAGQWIAERAVAERFFEKALTYPPRPERPGSDQMVIAHALCYNPEFHPTIKLDRGCEIFQIYTDFVPISFPENAEAASGALGTALGKTRARMHYRRETFMRKFFGNGKRPIGSFFYRNIVWPLKLLFLWVDRMVGAIGIRIKASSPRTYHLLKLFWCS